MSQEHVEIVRRQYAAFAARDWAALAELCHPDVEYETLKTAPGVSGCYRGLGEITGFFDSWSGLYAEFRVEATEMVDAGDQVVTVERQRARGLKGSDAETWIQDSFACLISFKDGKIWRIAEFPTLEQALEAAGPGDSARPR
jgi:ketosteroid isomerase-like protein